MIEIAKVFGRLTLLLGRFVLSWIYLCLLGGVLGAIVCSMTLQYASVEYWFSDFPMIFGIAVGFGVAAIGGYTCAPVVMLRGVLRTTYVTVAFVLILALLPMLKGRLEGSVVLGGIGAIFAMLYLLGVPGKNDPPLGHDTDDDFDVFIPPAIPGSDDPPSVGDAVDDIDLID